MSDIFPSRKTPPLRDAHGGAGCVTATMLSYRGIPSTRDVAKDGVYSVVYTVALGSEAEVRTARTTGVDQSGGDPKNSAINMGFFPARRAGQNDKSARKQKERLFIRRSFLSESETLVLRRGDIGDGGIVIARFLHF